MNIATKEFDYERHQRIVRAAMPCKCQSREIRKKVDKRGRVRLRAQCPGCGRPMGDELRYSVLNGGRPQDVPPWDDGAERSYWSIYNPLSDAAKQVINQERSDDWWRQYATYLKSEEWRELRSQVIRNAGGWCVYCTIRPAVQVHHWTYERVGHEAAEDLGAVCLECHRLFHPHLR